MDSGAKNEKGAITWQIFSLLRMKLLNSREILQIGWQHGRQYARKYSASNSGPSETPSILEPAKIKVAKIFLAIQEVDFRTLGKSSFSM